MTTLVGGIDNASSGGGAPSGPAGGDLGGTYPNPTVVSVADVTTGVLAAANGGVASGALNGFFGGYVWPGAIGAGTALSAASPSASANQVFATLFTLPFSCTVNKIVLRVTTLSASDKWGFGIYNSSGTTLLVDSGIISPTATGQLSTTISASALSAGTYYFAQTASGTTAQLNFQALDANAVVLSINANRNRSGLAANTSSGGQLPATLGAINTGTTRGLMIVWFEN